MSLAFLWRGLVFAALLSATVQATGTPVQGQDVPDVAGVRPPNEAEVKTVKALLVELDRDPDTVVADIAPRSVTKADVAAAIRSMPAYLASRPAIQVYQDGVGMAMQQTILAVRALAAGLDKQPSVAYRLRNAAEDVLADTYLRGTLNANITDEVLRRAYDQLIAGKPGPDEVDARIIVTDTAAAGQIALSRIQAGVPFDIVAQTDSLDGSASNGGDLGYVRADLLSPELAAVLFSMAVGDTSAHPVQSGDHWFVLKVGGRRVAPAPTFDEARPTLAHDLALIEVGRIKQKMVADAKVVYRDVPAQSLPGSPIGSAAALEGALAQFGKSPDVVVAEVDGRPVTIADVIEAIRLLPRVNAEATFAQIVRQADDLVIARKVLAEKAEAAGLPTSPVVRRRIEAAQDRILGQELLTRSLAPNLLEPAVKSTYEARPISKTEVPEVQLRVIAVPTRAQAEDLVLEIKNGADFAELARTSSHDSSAARGGLLDYHWQETLAPALGAIGFSMNVGGMTTHPVASGGLWWLVRCEGRRMRPPLTFAEARRDVETDIVKTGSAELRQLAIKQTSVSYYGLLGKNAHAAAAQ